MPKLIAILEEELSRIEIMRKWLSDRLWMYEPSISYGPNTLLEAIESRFSNVLVLCLSLEVLCRTEKSQSKVIDALQRQSERFPILLYSNDAVAESSKSIQSKLNGWSVHFAGIPDLDSIGTNWYPALKKAIHQNAEYQAVKVSSDAD